MLYIANIQSVRYYSANTNYEADKNNVSEKERKTIMEKLECAYMASHIGYREPETHTELELQFDGG